MCSPTSINFGRAQLSRDEVRGKKILEVGSLNVNGSLRDFIEDLGPLSYLGVDIADGPGVDEKCDISNLIFRYGNESFDVVICTELLEHVRNWRAAVSNLKNVLKLSGILIITTRSKGTGFHGYPFDFWRYEVQDMNCIFSDLSIDANEQDIRMPGVFLKAHKSESFTELNLEEYELFSIIKPRRCKNISDADILFFKVCFKAKKAMLRMLPTRAKARAKAIIREFYLTEEIPKLVQLYDQGVLTDEEFTAQKAKLLG
jgi:SAM-dependent methyltransferase